jgi:hypothetical protein
MEGSRRATRAWPLQRVRRTLGGHSKVCNLCSITYICAPAYWVAICSLPSFVNNCIGIAVPKNMLRLRARNAFMFFVMGRIAPTITGAAVEALIGKAKIARVVLDTGCAHTPQRVCSVFNAPCMPLSDILSRIFYKCSSEFAVVCILPKPMLQ